MPVQGNLATMSLAEILQWLGSAGKTGTLSIERNKVVKRILVREGRVIACASQEPPKRSSAAPWPRKRENAATWAAFWSREVR
jgi:hypothetical protein